MSGKEAIVLVPGLQDEERGQRLEVLVENLRQANVRYPVTEREDIVIAGQEGVRLSLADGRAVDLFEAYWGDMRLSEEPTTPLGRIRQATVLIFYWIGPWVKDVGWRSPWMVVSLLASGVILLGWYVSIVVLAAQAIADDDRPGAPGEAADTAFGRAVEYVAEFLAMAALSSWWPLFLAILTAFMAPRLANIASFAKGYLTNRLNADRVGLRDRVAHRVRGVLNAAFAEDYGRITLLGHSFGGLVAVDVIAEHPDAAGRARTRLVTWGSPTTVLCARSDWLRREVDRLLEDGNLIAWDDYFIERDWLGAPAPAHSTDRALSPTCQEVTLDRFWLDGLSGRTHGKYFQTQRLLENLLEPPGRAAGERHEDRHDGRPAGPAAAVASG